MNARPVKVFSRSLTLSVILLPSILCLYLQHPSASEHLEPMLLLCLGHLGEHGQDRALKVTCLVGIGFVFLERSLTEVPHDVLHTEGTDFASGGWCFEHFASLLRCDGCHYNFRTRDCQPLPGSHLGRLPDEHSNSLQ